MRLLHNSNPQEETLGPHSINFAQILLNNIAKLSITKAVDSSSA